MMRSGLQFILVVILLGACTKAPQTRNTVLVSGVAHLNRVRSGKITLQKLNEDGTPGLTLGTTDTDTEGNFSLLVSRTSDPVILTLASGVYKDEATGNDRTLSADETYLSLKESLNEEKTNFHITPFTDLAARLALKKIILGYKSSATISTYYSEMAELIGLKGEDLRTLTPVDLSSASSVSAASLNEKNYSLVIAGLSQLIKNKAQPTLTTKAQLATFLEDYFPDSDFDTTDWEEGLSIAVANWISSSQNTLSINSEGMGFPVSAPTESSFSDIVALTVNTSLQTTSISWTALSNVTYDLSVKKVISGGGYTPIYALNNSTATTATLTKLALANYSVSLKVKKSGTTVKSLTKIFTVSAYEVPVITEISPRQRASGDSGFTMTISGRLFQTDATVLMGDLECTGVQVLSPTQITCVAPTGRGITPVTVTNPNGKSHTLAGEFIYGTGNSWATINTTGAPSARIHHTAVWTGSKMVVWGGYYGGTGVQELNSGTMYDPVADSWSAITTLAAPSVRYLHGAVWTGSKMLVWGGTSGTGAAVTLHNTGGSYDPILNSWSALSVTNSPVARYVPAMAWTGKVMIVVGGIGGSINNVGYLDSGGRYDPNTNSWLATSTTDAPYLIDKNAHVWTGSKLICYANGVGAGSIYDPEANSWTIMTSTGAPAFRLETNSVWTGSKMLLWGGTLNQTYYNTGAMYDPNTNAWSAISTTNAPTARAGHLAVWTGGRMLVWGGYYNETTLYNTSASFDPNTNTWITLSTTNSPSPRYEQVGVWTGAYMLVSGGYTGVSFENTGGIYTPPSDPYANSWAQIATTGAPLARYSSASVWTGSEMLVWGGYSGGNLNTGGAYNPVTNTWREIDSTYAPAASAPDLGVWTGSKMLVWGGTGAGAGTNEGGQYDPVLNSWSSTQTLGAPTPRYSMMHTWSGSKLLLFGGTGADNEGGIYDPIANTWSAMTTTGAPSARRAEAAVWIGAKALFWGGENAGYFNDGGIYDPVSNSWSIISTTGAPSPRAYAPSAFWMGSKALIWGGYLAAAYTNTGGIYDPHSNQWTTVSTVGAPQIRYQSSNLWTGSRMLVWGGSDASAELNTGGIYDPVANQWTTISTTNAPSVRTIVSAVWTGYKALFWGGWDRAGGGTSFNSGGIYQP